MRKMIGLAAILCVSSVAAQNLPRGDSVVRWHAASALCVDRAGCTYTATYTEGPDKWVLVHARAGVQGMLVTATLGNGEVADLSIEPGGLFSLTAISWQLGYPQGQSLTVTFEGAVWAVGERIVGPFPVPDGYEPVPVARVLE